MGEQVVIPSRVLFAAIIRRDQNDVVTVGEVCERRLPALAAARTDQRQDQNRHPETKSHAPTGCLHERGLDWCNDLAPNRATGLSGEYFATGPPCEVPLPRGAGVKVVPRDPLIVSPDIVG
jgi:hypothetical protein